MVCLIVQIFSEHFSKYSQGQGNLGIVFCLKFHLLKNYLMEVFVKEKWKISTSCIHD